MSSKTPITNWVAHKLQNPLPLEEHIKNWEKANAIYYGPDRDHENWPISKIPENTPPTRFAFIPDSWFTFFYEKTGVTGPYVFAATVTTTLFSKELWLIEHGLMDFMSFWLMCWFLIVKAGPSLKKMVTTYHEEYHAKHWAQPMAEVQDDAVAAIKSKEEAIWQLEASPMIFEAKRENVDLELESIYRKRLVDVHHEVKKRLDYQMEVENTGRRFEQTHMVNWIVENVVKGITPQQEKDSIAKCIADLKGLAAKQA